MNQSTTKDILRMDLRDDPTAASRKQDHIELAFKSQVAKAALDGRFYYEPLLAAHPNENVLGKPFDFVSKQMQMPLWVSSMTGGTEMARIINENLAKACKEFGMGMGLGSCRSILKDDTYFEDFNIRKWMGEEAPLYANLGIAQVEKLVEENDLYLISEMLDKLRADGLIIHVNPLQEWLQPEGDRFKKPPIETIMRMIDAMDIRIIVKEVGQGMGYESLKTLFRLPLEAIDFAANGGTNFAKLELLRSDAGKQEIYSQLANVGHSAEEMVQMTNEILEELGDKALCKQVIISGGIQNFLDGYYLINKLQCRSVYGQASAFLKHARGDYDTLRRYIQSQVKGLALAQAFLKVK